MSKRATDWLRRGATMLSESCPVCYSPLFKLSGEIWCPTCNKQVVMVKREEDVSRLTASLLFSSVGEAVLSKVQEILRQIKDEKNVEKIQPLAQSLSTLLDVYVKTEKLRKRKS